MKFTSALITAGSGSIRGCTASRNRSGAYLRGRVQPVNPGSSFQNAVRGYLASLVATWTSNLTQAQRTQWDTWADNTPQTDGAFGTYLMTGQNAFISMNAPRMQAGQAIILVAPVVYAGAALTPPVLTIADVSTQLLTVTFLNTDVWAAAVGGFLAVFMGPPQNPSVNFYKGPYRFISAIAGAVVPPTSPVTFAPPFPFFIGQRVHVAFRAMQADARISIQTRSSVLTVA